MSTAQESTKQNAAAASARKPRTAEQIAASNAKRKVTMAAKKAENQPFPRFNELPKELRLTIWEMALPGGRVVSIQGAPLRFTIREWNERVDEQALLAGADNDEKEEPYLVESLANKTYLVDGTILQLLSEGVGFTRLQHILGMSTAGQLHHWFKNTSHELNFTGFGDVCELIEDHLAKKESGIKSSQPPNALFACKESRTAALKVVPMYSAASFTRHCAVGEAYFDGHRDTLYMRDTLQPDRPGLGQTVRYLSNIKDIETLPKIGNLAISLDRGHSTPGNNYWPHQLGHLDELLRRLNGVKKLTFVVQHFGEWGTETNEEILFDDPVDIDSMIKIYELYSQEICKEDPLRAAEFPSSEEYSYNFDWTRLSSLTVAQHNAFLAYLGTDSLVFPSIEYKVAITSSYQKRLETARKDCQARCNAHNTRPKTWLEVSINT